MTCPLHLTKEKLQALYDQENLTVKNIAVTLRCSRTTIHKHLTEFGIQRRTTSASARLAANTLWQSNDTEKIMRMKAKLREKSLEHWKTASPEQIAERNHKIQRLAYHKPEIMQEIKTLYDQGMKTCDIAKKFNVAKMTIIRAMHISNLQMRDGPPRYEPNLTPTYTLGYVLGVIYGDGWCTLRKESHAYEIGLNTIDREFVECFSFHLSRLLGRTPLPIRAVYCKTGERQTYYNALCTSNKLGQFYKNLTYDQLAIYLVNSSFRIGFLRGFFDSEGSISLHNHICHKNRVSKRHPKQLTITIHNTNFPLLKLIQKALSEEGITTYKIRHTPMPNRWNKKPLFILGLHSNQRNIPLFITKIGTRIKRKQNNIRLWKKSWLYA